MKRIINQKRYDTETAKELHRNIAQEDGYVDWIEILYLSPNNQPFIACQTSDDKDISIRLLNGWQERRAWLGKMDAPESAYEALGLEIEEG